MSPGTSSSLLISVKWKSLELMVVWFLWTRTVVLILASSRSFLAELFKSRKLIVRKMTETLSMTTTRMRNPRFIGSRATFQNPQKRAQVLENIKRRGELFSQIDQKVRLGDFNGTFAVSLPVGEVI